MKCFLSLAACWLWLLAPARPADTLVLFPQPQSIRYTTGTAFVLTPATPVQADRPATAMLPVFNQQLIKRYGFTLKTGNSSATSRIRLRVNPSGDSTPGYQISIQPRSVSITGNTPAGLFYGLQTFFQLLENGRVNNAAQAPSATSFRIPCLTITDAPRFAYRGMHLDVSRHFFTVAEVKHYIDYLAAYKFNTFHWHLTDDQGWRIEIKKYPRLTSIGGWRNGTIIGRYPGTGNDYQRYGGFYTQEQIREVVRYAADRFITVVPEIEMPGHASAAIAAYPQLSCFPDESTRYPPQCTWSGDTTGKQVQQTWGVFEDVFCPSDTTFRFLEDVLDEVMDLFPSRYIHIGGDECPKTAWKRSAFCRRLMQEKGLANEHELQSYFIRQIEQYLNRKGRRIIGWDEILEGGLAPNATVMSWTGEEGGIKAARQNHDVIMTPGAYCYFDHSQSRNEDSVTFGGYLPVETVYYYDPVPAVLDSVQARHITGAQANVWTEYIGNFSKLQYTLFPRMAAISEVLWTQPPQKDPAAFERRLPVLFDRLEQQKIHYSKAYYTIVDSILPAPGGKGLTWKLQSKAPGVQYRITQEGTAATAPDATAGTIPQQQGGTVEKYLSAPGRFTAALYQQLPGGTTRHLATITRDFSFNKATGKKIVLTNPPSRSYPGTGAFTLVDGIRNKRQLERSAEFLGFSGKDCEAAIDLGQTDTIRQVVVHTLNQPGSWIYLPGAIEVSIRPEVGAEQVQPVFTVPQGKAGNNAFTISFPPVAGRFVKIRVRHFGTIPDGLAGAGNLAWLFVDEIEVR